DLDNLAAHIRWRKGEGKKRLVEFDSHPQLPAGKNPPAPDRRTTKEIASSEDAERFGSLRSDDVIRPARLLLQRWLHEPPPGRRQLLVRVDDDDGDLKLTAKPSHLLAAMWLQLALAASEHKQYRACTVCENPFELSPETARTNRRFCSIACK